MDFCEACGVCIDPEYMKPDLYGDKLICCPECAEAHGLKGDNDYDEPGTSCSEPFPCNKVA